MANRFFSDVSASGEPRAKAAAKPYTPPKGSAKPAPEVKEKTAAWPQPGPAWKSSFNRTSKVPVVKTRAAKRGIA